MFSMESSNPTFKAAQGMAYEGSNQATLQGVAEKTVLLVAITAIAGAAAYVFIPLAGSLVMISSIAAFVVCMGVAFALNSNPARAPYLAPVYAVVEGGFLGLLTRALDSMLFSMGIGAEITGGASLALPAFVITVCCAGSMLVLYRAGVIRPTARFKAVVGTLTMGVMLAYMAMFALSFFGVQVPYLSLGSAMEGGQTAMIGLGLNVAILGLASLVLVIDFGRIEAIVNSGKPKTMEWFGAFSLLVTLAWIYYEAVKLAFRLAIMFSNRD